MRNRKIGRIKRLLKKVITLFDKPKPRDYGELTIEELRKEARENYWDVCGVNKRLMRECHRRLWDWLSKNVGKKERGWPGWDFGSPGVFGGRHILNSSFLCETFDTCSKCPLGEPNACECYKAWKRANRVHWGSAKRHAEFIRDA